MAKVSPLINNFSAGEFGPLTSARVDLDRYGQSAEEMTNFIPTVQGAAQKRTGTKYVGAAAVNTGNVRLESFVFSNDQAYVLEFYNDTGVTYFRLYTNGSIVTDGVSPVFFSIANYLDSELFELSFNQLNDIIYVHHKNHLTYKIIRLEDDNWICEAFLYKYGPYIENNSYYDDRKNFRYLTPSAATGSSITLTPYIEALTKNSPVNGYVSFTITSATDVKLRVGEKLDIKGRITGSLYGYYTATVTFVNGTTFYINTLDVDYPYVSNHSLYLKPQEFMSFTTNSVIFLYDDSTGTWGSARLTSINNTASSGATTYTAEVINTLSNTNAKYLIKIPYGESYPVSSCFFEDRLIILHENLYVACSKTGDYENFIPVDIDGTTSPNYGFTFYVAASQSSGGKWLSSGERGILMGTNSGEFLIKSASNQTPLSSTSIDVKQTTAFGSASIQPVKAGKAVVFAQASGRKLREFNYFFDVDGFRCQDLNQLAHHITKTGIKQIAIQKQPEQIVWAVRNDGVLLGMTYERDIDGLRVAWHKHILGGAKNSNGDEVEVLSIACIPTDDNSYDEVWMVVKRLINGSIAYSIEYMDQPFSDEVEQEDSRFLDCSLTYNQPKTITAITKANPAKVTAASHGFNDGDKVRFDNIEGMTELNGNIYIVSNKTTNDFELKDFDGNNINSTSYSTYFANGEARKLVTTISGLTHLNGQQVVAFGDGANIGTFTVSAGSITLDEPAAVVTIGLKYKARIKLPRLEAGSTDGTALGKTRRIHRLGAAVYRTLGLKYGQDFDNMQSFEFQDGDDQLNQAPPLYTGIITTEVEFDYDFNNNICLESDEPNNCTILAVMPQMHTQDR